MDTMPLVQIHGVDDVRLDSVPRPRPGARDVLVKVSACGICGSDLGYIAMGGLTPPGQPMPLGHELCGTVEAVGEQVQGLQPGQYVTVNPMGNDQAIGNGGPRGGFAPLLLVENVVDNAGSVLPIPESFTPEQGALIEPLAVAMHGVHQSGVRPGQSVAVLGAGPIGLCTVVVLRYFGIENILVADRSAARLQLARELGASSVCNVDSEDLARCLSREQGEAAVMGMPVPATDVYIEATGVGPVLEQLIGLARQGAVIVVVGVHKGPVQLDPVTLLFKELRLIGSMAYPDEFPQVIAMLESGRVDVTPLVSHRYPLARFMDALAVARDPERAAKVIITMA